MMFRQDYPYRLALAVGGGACLFGLLLGSLAGTNPLLIGVLFVAIAAPAFFFWRFEQASLCLLIIRSALDAFSNQGLPAAFAMGLNILIVLYLLIRLLAGHRIQTDRFWWLFAGWVALQGCWVILQGLGGLAFDASYLSTAVREWLRLFSWLMVYLMVMQLRDRLDPVKVIHLLMLALVIPLAVALLQVLVPHGLPAFLAINPDQDGYRVNGTLGLANTFASFLALSFCLTYWRLNQAQNKLPWLCLLAVLIFLITTTRTLVGLVMLAVAMLMLMANRFSPAKLLGLAILFGLTILVFSSSEFGQARLASIADTPLLNPDLDLSRSILLSGSDQNSFNWRLAQWNYLLTAWRKSPILGYGLGTAPYMGNIFSAAHNDYVRALFESGIVGFIAFLGFLQLQIARLIKLIRSPLSTEPQKQFCWALFSFLMAAMVAMLTENIWSHTANFFYWYAFLAIAGWNWSQYESVNRSESS